MVNGSDSILVTFDEPLRSTGSMIVKYKSTGKSCSPTFLQPYFSCSLVEWSDDEHFSQVSSDIIHNDALREYLIRNLSTGQKCYVRLSAANLRGFGPTVLADPVYCVPSSMCCAKKAVLRLLPIQIGDLCLKRHG